MDGRDWTPTGNATPHAVEKMDMNLDKFHLFEPHIPNLGESGTGPVYSSGSSGKDPSLSDGFFELDARRERLDRRLQLLEQRQRDRELEAGEIGNFYYAKMCSRLQTLAHEREATKEQVAQLKKDIQTYSEDIAALHATNNHKYPAALELENAKKLYAGKFLELLPYYELRCEQRNVQRKEHCLHEEQQKKKESEKAREYIHQLKKKQDELDERIIQERQERAKIAEEMKLVKQSMHARQVRSAVVPVPSSLVGAESLSEGSVASLTASSVHGDDLATMIKASEDSSGEATDDTSAVGGNSAEPTAEPVPVVDPVKSPLAEAAAILQDDFPLPSMVSEEDEKIIQEHERIAQGFIADEARLQRRRLEEDRLEQEWELPSKPTTNVASITKSLVNSSSIDPAVESAAATPPSAETETLVSDLQDLLETDGASNPMHLLTKDEIIDVAGLEDDDDEFD